MAWNSQRPVPWRRLTIEWIVVTVGVVAAMLLFTDQRGTSAYIGLVWGGVVYFALGYALAKLGYQRARLSDARAQAGHTGVRDAPPTRAKPAPTKRTGGGNSRPGSRSRR